MTISKTSIEQTAGTGTASGNRRAWATRTAIAAAVALAVAGGHWAVAQASATSTTPAQGSSAPRAGARRRLDDVSATARQQTLAETRKRLSELERFPTAGLTPAALADAIARAILSLASALGVEVVAEGIETATQMSWLKDLHCAYGQGFLLGSPQPLRTVEEALDAQLWPTPRQVVTPQGSH